MNLNFCGNQPDTMSIPYDIWINTALMDNFHDGMNVREILVISLVTYEAARVTYPTVPQEDIAKYMAGRICIVMAYFHYELEQAANEAAGL
jgi:hypothetical protein